MPTVTLCERGPSFAIIRIVEGEAADAAYLRFGWITTNQGRQFRCTSRTFHGGRSRKVSDAAFGEARELARRTLDSPPKDSSAPEEEAPKRYSWQDRADCGDRN